MYDAYIARTANNLLYAFYHSPGNGVCQRVYANGRWGAALSVAVDARPGFVVCSGSEKNGRFYILYRNKDNEMSMLAGDMNGYAQVDAGRDFESACGVFPVVSDKGSFFITEERGNGGFRLSCRGQDIADCVPTSEAGFRAHIISGDHTVLFYHTARENPSFGYRELNTSQVGDYHPIHMGQGVSRYSVLTSNSNLHFLYITRSMFGSRLLYRRKGGAGLCAAVTVCEGSVDNCWLFIMHNRVYAAFMSGGSLYVSVSDNDGQSFRKPQRYLSKLCHQPVKAAYISALGYSEDDLALRELFVDGRQPWDVQILPELYPDFFPQPAHRAAFKEAALPSSEPITPQVPQNFAPEGWWYGEDIPESEKLRNQIESLERRLLDKDRQSVMLRQEVETQRQVIERLYKDIDPTASKPQG